MKKIITRTFAAVLFVSVASLSGLVVFADTPPTVTDLVIADKNTTSTTLKWNVSSVAIDANAVYDVRYSTQEITAATFSAATPAQQTAITARDVAGSGTKRTYTVKGLTAGTTYFFAVESSLGGGTWSPISNVTSTKTSQPSSGSGSNSNRNNGSPYTVGGAGYTTGTPTNNAQGNPLNTATLGASTNNGAGNTSGTAAGTAAGTTEKPKPDNYSGLIKCSGVASGQGETECNFNSFISTVANLINWAFYLALPVAVVLFSWAGILYISGVPSKIAQAHSIFRNTAIGFIIMLVAFTCVHTVLGWLVNPSIGAETLLSK